LNSPQQVIQDATPIASKAWDTNQNQQIALRRGRERVTETMINVEQKRNASIHQDAWLKNAFRSLHSWVTTLNTMTTDMFQTINSWNNKPKCNN
jgi:hypothetical protein